MFFQNSNCVELKECVACGSSKLKPVLNLGKQPLANSYKLHKDEVQEEYPLAINHCEDCYHVQLSHAVNPELMFTDYLYVTGTSKTMQKHCEDFANLVDNAAKAKTILDIGCNDGTQLNYFANLNYETFGVDPAKNLYERSSKNHKVWCDFFNLDFVKNLSQKFDVITAQNVFAHGPNPLGFLNAAKEVMHDDSLLFVQTSQANMIKNNEFDTIYHEHISFFNAQSMKKLCERAGLFLIDVQYMPIHGTSYIFVIGKQPRPGNVESIIENERSFGLYQHDTYVKYAKRCDEIVKEFLSTVRLFSSGMIGWIVVGYGAPAKGMTLLNYSGLKLDYIVDDNPLKQNRFTPGSSIPIYSSSRLGEYQDAIAFVPLAWNFYDEIVSKIKEIRKNNLHGKFDRFITYFPEVGIRE